MSVEDDLDWADKQGLLDDDEPEDEDEDEEEEPEPEEME